MVTARAFAARNRHHVDANQEMLALGAANVLSAVTQGLPLSASGSRTAVAESAGSGSQVTSLAAATTIVFVLLFLTPLLRPLPQAALAGILLAAAWNLCSFAEFGRMWRFGRGGFVLAIVTLLGIAGVGVLEGILLGVVLSLILLVRHAAFPQDAVLGRVNGGADFRDLSRSTGSPAVPGVLVYRMAGPLFFPNAQHFKTRVLQLVDASQPRITHVVIDAAPITGVDLPGADSLVELMPDLRTRGTSLAIADAYAPLRDELQRAGVLDVLGAANLFPTIDAAVNAAGARQ